MNFMNIGRINKNLAILKGYVHGQYGCGWMNDDISRIIYEFVVFYQPHLVIQTGYLWGKSSLMILEALRDSAVLETGDSIEKIDVAVANFINAHCPRVSKNARLITVDPNVFNLPIEEGVEFLKREYGNFELTIETSQNFFKKNARKICAEYKGSTILGVIDGDHNYEGCLTDLINCDLTGCKIILVDDTLWIPYIGRLSERFARQRGYYYLNLKLYNGIGILIKKERTTFRQNAIDYYSDFLLEKEILIMAIRAKLKNIAFLYKIYKFF